MFENLKRRRRPYRDDSRINRAIPGYLSRTGTPEVARGGGAAVALEATWGGQGIYTSPYEYTPTTQGLGCREGALQFIVANAKSVAM